LEQMTRRALMAGALGSVVAMVPGVASAATVAAAGRGRMTTGASLFPNAKVRPGVPLSPRSVIVVTPMSDIPVPLSVEISSGADVFYVHAQGDYLPDPLPFSWAVLKP
jgi:hypothetical protein